MKNADWRPNYSEKVLCVSDNWIHEKGDTYRVCIYSRVFDQVQVASVDGHESKYIFGVNEFHKDFISYDNLTDEEVFAFKLGGVDAL